MLLAYIKDISSFDWLKLQRWIYCMLLRLGPVSPGSDALPRKPIHCPLLNNMASTNSIGYSDSCHLYVLKGGYARRQVWLLTTAQVLFNDPSLYFNDKKALFTIYSWYMYTLCTVYTWYSLYVCWIILMLCSMHVQLNVWFNPLIHLGTGPQFHL